MSRCRACNAPLEWVKTPSGKAVPLNPEPINGLLLEGAAGLQTARERGWRVVTGYDERGEVRRVAEAPLDQGGTWVTVRETHFSDCPERGKFRRR